VSKQFVLQITIKAVNNTAGPNGLVLTLLMFSTYPQITTTDTLSLIVTEHSKTITKAIKQIAELYAKKQVINTLKQQNGPNISNTLNVLIGKDVLIYKKNKG
jgi:uncharacterized coiled-coil protein SlyX